MTDPLHALVWGGGLPSPGEHWQHGLQMAMWRPLAWLKSIRDLGDRSPFSFGNSPAEHHCQSTRDP
jgi:hypothetical protein